MSAAAVTHEALVECGIYFTSSPGYAVYSDATTASAETDRIEARVNTVTRLQSFWAAGPSTVICRREAHPWVDETASALMAQLSMAHGNVEEALHTPA